MKLYIKLPGKSDRLTSKVKPMLAMFPGSTPTIIYYADTGVREGGRVDPDTRLINRLKELLGPENVVLKH